jgi:hypothetical protein
MIAIFGIDKALLLVIHSAVRSLTNDLHQTHSTRNLPRWQVCFLIAALLLVLTIVYFWQQLIVGKALYWGDIGLYFLPMQMFLHQNLAAGHLPLWNPLILCGTPYIGNPQTWPLYPITALLAFVSPTQFINLTVALHVWLAGLGTYAFARRSLGFGLIAALLAAVTFMFGGQLVSKEQFPNMVQAAAYLPWVLLYLDRLLCERRRRDALALGLVLGLQLLAAHVQMTVLTLYLATGYGLVRWRVKLDQLRQTIGLLLLSGVVASGLAAGQILPTLALFQDASRHRLSFHTVNRFYLPYNQLGNFIYPKLHGTPFYGNWSAAGNIWETCCYVGVVPFALFVWGIWAAWRKQEGGQNNARRQNARFWTVVFAIGTVMALGGKGGLYHLAYWGLPGFKSFHDPARCLLWACFALSLLAGWGWEQLPIRAPQPNRRFAMGSCAILLAFADLAHFGQTLYPLVSPSILFPQSPNITAVQADADIAAHQARILAPTNGVWLRFTNYKDFRQSAPNYQALWADTLTPNLTMPYGLSQADGYEPVAYKTTEAATSLTERGFAPKASARDQATAAAQAGRLGVKYIAVCQVQPPEKKLPGLVLIRAAPTLSEVGHPRAIASVFLSQNSFWQPRAHLSGSKVAVALTDDGPDQVSLTVTTLAPARLILEDTAAAGWHATVDGHETPIQSVSGCLRAVPISTAGSHRIEFAYSPTPFRIGLYLSLLTVLLLTSAGSFAIARNPGKRNVSERNVNREAGVRTGRGE